MDSKIRWSLHHRSDRLFHRRLNGWFDRWCGNNCWSRRGSRFLGRFHQSRFLRPLPFPPDQSEVDVSKVRAAHADVVHQLQAKYPGGLTWLSQSDAKLVFTAAGMRSDFKDTDFKNVQPLAPLIVQLDLTGADVSDDSSSVLASMTSLRLLRLPETQITDRSIPAIAGLAHLESLNLYGTAIDRAIDCSDCRPDGDVYWHGGGSLSCRLCDAY